MNRSFTRSLARLSHLVELSQKVIANEKRSLFTAAIALVVMLLSATWKITGDPNRVSTDAVCYGIALTVIWQKRDRMKLESGWLATALGLVLLAWVIFKTWALVWFDTVFLKIAPFVAFLALTLLASGFKRLGQYWLPFSVLVLMVMPTGSIEALIQRVIPVSSIGAQASAFFLHYVGIDVVRNGTVLTVPGGGIEVFAPCTGVPMVVLLLKLSLLYCLAFSTNWKQRLGAPLSAIAIGALLAGIRLALMALVSSNKSRFNYWHGSEGANILSTIGVMAFVCFCWYVVERLGERGNSIDAASRCEPPVPFAARTCLLAVSSCVAGFVALGWLLFPAMGQRHLSSVEFPNPSSPAGWTPVGTTDLLDVRTNISYAFDLIECGKRYLYSNDSIPIQVDLRNVTGTLGSVADLIERQAALPERTFEKAEIRRCDGSGFYGLFAHEGTAYLSASINAQGGSTVNPRQFLENRHNYDLRPQRLLVCLVSAEPLRDRRELWVLMSTPVNEDLSAAYQRMETGWQSLYPGWASWFARHAEKLKY